MPTPDKADLIQQMLSQQMLSEERLRRAQTEDAGATPPAEGAPESAPHSSSSSCADRETRIVAGEWRPAVKLAELLAAHRDGQLSSDCSDINDPGSCGTCDTLDAAIKALSAPPVPDPGTAEGAGEEAAGTATGSATDLAIVRLRSYIPDNSLASDALAEVSADVARLSSQLSEAQTMTAQRDEANRQLEVANATIDLLIPKQDEADAEIARLSLQLHEAQQERDEAKSRALTLQDGAFHFLSCRSCCEDGEESCSTGRKFSAFLRGEPDWEDK